MQNQEPTAPTRRAAETVVRGLTFPEAPRWHEGALWYIEIPGHRLRRLTVEGIDDVVAEFIDRPASVDFLPSGAAIVAMGDTLQLARLDGTIHANLSALRLNGKPFEKFGDMVIDRNGRAYVGCVGARGSLTEVGRTDIDAIALVDVNGSVSIAATGNIDRPNGMAISPDGSRLVVGESLAHRLTQWDIEPDGSLVRQRDFASTGEDIPDGVCMDEHGAAWVSGVHSRRTIRVEEGGRVTDVVPTDDSHFAIAPMLGGHDGRELYVVSCSTPSNDLRGHQDVITATGYVERVTVSVAGAGWPRN